MKKYFSKIKGKLSTKLATIGVGTAALVQSTMCNAGFDGNAGAQKVINFVFNAILLGGIVMIAMGVIQIAKAVSEGESAPPNAVPKALGFLIAGIIMCAIKTVLRGIGVPVDNFQLY